MHITGSSVPLYTNNKSTTDGTPSATTTITISTSSGSLSSRMTTAAHPHLNVLPNIQAAKATGTMHTPDQPQAAFTSTSYASTKVLDLHDQGLTNLKSLHAKFHSKHKEDKYPWSIILLHNNLLHRLEGLHHCSFLRKLDLSNNNIALLPNSNFWKCLPKLEVLHLHNNKIDSVHALQELSVLPHLTILTCYGNPVEHHPAYRHVLVNVNLSLVLLDFYIISDQELIEGSNFGPMYGTYSSNLEVVLPHYDGLNEHDHLAALSYSLRLVHHQHRAFSPVLKLQSIFRGILVRRTMKVYREAATCIQRAFRKYCARRVTNKNRDATPGRYNPASFSVSSTTIFIVQTTEIATNLFMQIVKRMEESEEMCASPITDANMMLLSYPSLTDDFPLVRRVMEDQHLLRQHIKAGSHLRCGRGLSHRERRALHKLQRRGCYVPISQRTYMSTYHSTTQHKRFLQFQSPSSRFHENLIRAIHKYNIEMGNYDAPSTPHLTGTDQSQINIDDPIMDPNAKKIIIYPGSTVSIIAAAITIQSTFRSYRSRRLLPIPIGRMLLIRRAHMCLVRWWKRCIFRGRLRMLIGLKRYGETIQSRHLYLRGDTCHRIKIGSHAFVKRQLWPEHRTLFGIYVDPSHTADDDTQDQQHVYGQLISFIDQYSAERIHPIPRWLLDHWSHAPWMMVRSDHIQPNPRQASITDRLFSIISSGVDVSLIRDLSLGFNDSAPTPSPTPFTSDSWYSSTHYIKLTFSSIEEARNRAITLVSWTMTPNRNQQDVAIMMTAQHVQGAVEAGYTTSTGERKYMCDTYWTRDTRQHHRSTYQHDQFLALQQRLQQEEKEKQEMDELIRHVDEIDASCEQKVSDDDFTISGRPSARIYVPLDLTNLKKETATLQRLSVRRALAETRIRQHHQHTLQKDRIAEQVMMHRVKMETVAEREREARQARALAYESFTRQLQIEHEHLIRAKREEIARAREEHTKRMEWAQMDREWEHAELRDRVEVEKMVHEKSVHEAEEKQRARIAELKAIRQQEDVRHRRLKREREETINFITQQNMITKQLQQGMLTRYHQVRAREISSLVHTRKTYNHTRREQVHEILYDNFHRRRQAALAQQIEMRQALNMRKTKDQTTLEMCKIRRQHAHMVRVMASTIADTSTQPPLLPAAGTTINSNTNSNSTLPYAVPLALPFPPSSAPSPSSALTVRIPSVSTLSHDTTRPHTSEGRVTPMPPPPPPRLQPLTHLSTTTTIPSSTLSPPPPGPAAASASASASGVLSDDDLHLQISVLRDLADQVKQQFQFQEKKTITQDGRKQQEKKENKKR